eukprot:175239-Chlamydomonas_euryale.AAC.5
MALTHVRLRLRTYLLSYVHGVRMLSYVHGMRMLSCMHGVRMLSYVHGVRMLSYVHGCACDMCTASRADARR